MSTITSIPTFPVDKQLTDTNWGSWMDSVISAVRGRGLWGNVAGDILRTEAPYSGHPSLANSTTPLTEEWDLRDAIAAAIIYGNIVDPRAHGIEVNDTSRGMWVKLHAKFQRTSEVLKGQAMDTLRSIKLDNWADLPAHLDALTKARQDAVCVGAQCLDNEYISIILGSLPASEFSNAMLILGDKMFAIEVIAYLRSYWELVYKPKMNLGVNGVAQALAANAADAGGNSGASACGNCHNGFHNRNKCWARGGGKEGYAPHWWKAPRGMEPRQAAINAVNIVKAARAGKTAAAAIAAAAATPPTPVYAPIAAAVFASPMATYTFAYDDGDNGDRASPFHPSSVPVVNTSPRFRYFGSDYALLNERVRRTVADVYPSSPSFPSIYMAGAVHNAPNVPTYLDSGATDTCVCNRKRFLSYWEDDVSSNTAVGGFHVVGRGRVRFTVWVEGGGVHDLVLDTIYTPEFSMNLISLPMLDRRGLVGALGDGWLVVSKQDGTKIVDGVLTRTAGRRELYQVDIVDDLDHGGDGIIAVIAGSARNQPTDLETWHRRFGHSDVRVIERMAAKSLVDGLNIVGRDLRGLCEDCIFGKIH
jgi:hypothetical protein